MISDPDVLGLLYLVSIVCFVLALRFLSSPKHARRGNWLGGVGMLVAIATTLADRGHLQLGAHRRRCRDRKRRRRRRRAQSEDDRDAADGGPVQRGRRRRGGARRARGVPRARRRARSGTRRCRSRSPRSSARSRSRARSSRSRSCRSSSAGGRSSFPGQNVVNILVARRRAPALGVAIVAGLEAQWAIVALIVLALRLRRHVRAADRRRRHARRHLAAQRVHGPRRVGDRLRPRLDRPHRRAECSSARRARCSRCSWRRR